MKVIKKILLGLAIVLGVVLLAVVALFTYLTISEFRPEPEELVWKKTLLLLTRS